MDKRLPESLHCAAAKGYAVEVERLIQEGNVNVDRPDKEDNMSENAVIALIKAKADVNRQVKKRGWTPLHYVACNGSMQAMAALTKAGADVNRAANDGATPLHLAAGWGNAAAITMLVDAEAKVNQQDKYGRTLLHAVMGALSGHEQAIVALVKAGADVNATDNEGNTPLDIARKEKELGAIWALQKFAAQ